MYAFTAARLSVFVVLALCLASCGKGATVSVSTSGETKAAPKDEAGPAKAGGEAKAEPEAKKEIPATPESETRKRLDDLIEIVKKGDYSKAAPFVAYRGADKARKWKDLCDYSKEDEKRHVDDVCAELRAIVERGQLEFVKFSSEKESEGEWLILEYKTAAGKVKAFAFLKIKDTYAIGDID